MLVKIALRASTDTLLESKDLIWILLGEILSRLSLLQFSFDVLSPSCSSLLSLI